MNEIALVENRDGIPVVSSRLVAEHFNKRHGDVLDKIWKIKEEIQPTEKSVGYFILTDYIDAKGESRKEYLLTRDGFTLTVMGFTGTKALEWKLKYIEAFNQMEAALAAQNQRLLPTTYKEALQVLLSQVEENERLLAENNELAPKAMYCDDVLSKPGLITISTIAKDLGFTSGTALNQIMFMNGIIYRDSGVWKPYAKYEWLITDGYADYQSYNKVGANLLLKWTEKGRKWIADNVQDWIAA